MASNWKHAITIQTKQHQELGQTHEHVPDMAKFMSDRSKMTEFQ